MDHKPVIHDDHLESAFKGLDAVWDLFEAHYGRTRVDDEVPDDFVTEMDGLIEEKIISQIEKDYEECSFLSEERHKNRSDKTYVSEKDVQWIIDPIDGSVNYFRGSLPAGISIFAEVDGELRAGVIGLPNKNKVCYGVKGKGTYVNDSKVECSETDSIGDSVVDMQFGDSRVSIDGYIDTVERLSEEARQIVCSRTGVYDFSMISEGKLDGAINLETNPWDVAGAYLLVNEAGGKVTTRHGDANWKSVKKGDAVASNGRIHSDLIKDFN